MFQIDIYSRVPVYEQLIAQVERFILIGIFKENDKLPSVRNLSVSLSVNPNTIQKAYTDLDRKGIIYSAPGKGCFISDNAKELIMEYRREKLNDLAFNIKELAIAGINMEEVIDCVKQAYNQSETLVNDLRKNNSVIDTKEENSMQNDDRFKKQETISDFDISGDSVDDFRAKKENKGDKNNNNKDQIKNKSRGGKKV